MDIEFAANRLAIAGVDLSEATRLFGLPTGRRYIQRLGVIRAADNFNQLYGHRALRLHLLRGSRAGQYAMTLTGNYRLILQRINGETVRILGVEDYHGN